MWLFAAIARFRSESAQAHAEDRDALRRLADGDAGAAAALYDRHARAIYSLILRILGDEAEAEDVVQDVFAQVWRQAARYDESRGVVAAWLLMIARTRALDRLRARRARPEGKLVADERSPDELPATAPDVADVLVDAERARRVREALRALPLLQRVAIELAYYEGLSQSEIAARLEQPLGTVKTRIRLGLMKMREALTEQQA
jgi:RNA polymerase sigma-70 factor (ECF subfamily)